MIFIVCINCFYCVFSNIQLISTNTQTIMLLNSCFVVKRMAKVTLLVWGQCECFRAH